LRLKIYVVNGNGEDGILPSVKPDIEGLLGSDANSIAVHGTAPEGRAGGTMNLDSDPKNPKEGLHNPRHSES